MKTKTKTLNFKQTEEEFKSFEDICETLGMKKSQAFEQIKTTHLLRSGNPVLVAHAIIETSEKEMLFLNEEQKKEVVNLLKSHYEKK